MGNSSPGPDAPLATLVPTGSPVRAATRRAGPSIVEWCVLGMVSLLLGGANTAGAAVLPSLAQDLTPYNFQSVRGSPLSGQTNAPAGSDGRVPAANESEGSVNYTPTGHQFRSLLSFGSAPGRTQSHPLTDAERSLLAGPNVFSYRVAAAMHWPVARTNGDDIASICLILRRAQVGAPYLSRQVSFRFGSIVSMPDTDEKGLLLESRGILKESYWRAQPFADGHTNEYYWSPYASRVFAVQPGPIAITWMRLAPCTPNELATYTNPGGPPHFDKNGEDNYLLHTVRYVVAGTPVKEPQQMYWTYGSFRNWGHLVAVPQGQVANIHVVHNATFPEVVEAPYDDPNSTPAQVNILGTNTVAYQEYRTLWFDNNTIQAYNAEGRVFVELLGGANEYLGFEIVDVARTPVPTPVTIELGERLVPPSDETDASALSPSPIQNSLGTQYYYQHSSGALYANRRTEHLNDLLVHWLTPGVAGLQWPHRFVRYSLVWPDDPAKYSHYLRPLVATEQEAARTAVQLNGMEAPALDDQDRLDQPRGKLTSSFAYYTFLDQAHPAHRGLLRFIAGEHVRFERVFSWLDLGLTNQAVLSGSVATNLSAWNGGNSSLAFSDRFTAPYVTNLTVNVGDRITAPAGELGGAGDTYWAGHIHQANGTSFWPGAYHDPFGGGFEVANGGAIIPVNAIPGRNRLEVRWFRRNQADVIQGFQPLYWPSVVGRYTLQWPAAAPEIILASNDGSGGLPSLQAKGSIYWQNDAASPGYNPNEEHAVMLGGQAYALRDDLNITAGPGYSSHPYVLLEYTEADGRPAMQAFHVRREAPEAGVVFDYVVEAGKLLQAPMPLPLLAPPVEGSGAYARNYNSEPAAGSGDLPVGWTGAGAGGPYAHYPRFTYEDRKRGFWVYRGPHAGQPRLEAGRYLATNGTFGPLPAATAVQGQTLDYAVHVSRRLESLTVSATNLPPGLTFQSTGHGLHVAGTPTTAGSNYATLKIQDTGDGSLVSIGLPITVVPSGTVVAQAPLALVSSNSYTHSVVVFTNRPPHLAVSPANTNCFTMRYYYKTLDGFAWPGLVAPAVGSIVPYLRPSGSTSDATSKETRSLDIVYRPVWPATVPALNSGQTLTDPISGLAAVRGQDSVQVLYQQSIGTNFTAAPASVVLHDPTVQKRSSLMAISGLPAGVLGNAYAGKVYFPKLPPNLVNRLYFDPNTTNLVFEGQFKAEGTGENYLLLNVLAGKDLTDAQDLCPATDKRKADWDTAILSLSTPVYTFHEDPDVPGSYVVDPDKTVTRSVSELVEVTSSDTAVDSYALSATGPGQGYLTYIVNNGSDPAQAALPVSVYIARVAPPLYRGEVKVIMAPSPLSEMITFQHTADLAGRAALYEYDWRILPPVDGQAPTAAKTTWTPLAQGPDLTHVSLGGAGIQTLADNWITMRYRCIAPLANPAITNWSEWAEPQLAEGWIKRVLAGINPFNQRTTDLFNNPANTTASIIAQAGRRYEGDVPLNDEAMLNSGLIEIYETVLNRGKDLSIEAATPINYGPANDALLLAAGYLNDLYMMLGNEAQADAVNPTIGIGTADRTYGNIATALFAFKGQVASVLEEELALLRGRDDFLSPGTGRRPVYNRLFWNYTRGIDAGEVIYALNYNILDQDTGGVVNAADAAVLYPQGHGDAYGHYLMALKNYYALLVNPKFDWVPRIETVTVLGAPVSVDYQDERKFAAAAAAVARAGRQIVDLTWRQYYRPGTSGGWTAFATNRANAQRSYTVAGVTNQVTRYWGLDHWASRVGQGTYLNWVVGNAMLYPTDPDRDHEGIQKVDRTTVPELQELPQIASALENDLDNANAGFTPLGLPENSVPFDIDPLQVTGASPQTHFEQVYDRAVRALDNAVVAFDDAQGVSQMLRSEEDSLSGFQASVTVQELAYNNQLIELYGTPYPDDIGVGKTWPQNYTGPDLIHYTYVENPDTNTYGGVLADPTTNQTYRVDIQELPDDFYKNYDQVVRQSDTNHYAAGTNYIAFNIGPNGFFDKPASWASRRVSPGSIQQAISALIAARNQLRQEMSDAQGDKAAFDSAINEFKALVATNAVILGLQNGILNEQQFMNDMQMAFDITDKWLTFAAGLLDEAWTFFCDSTPSDAAWGTDAGKVIYWAVGVPLMAAEQLTLAADATYFTVNSAILNGSQRDITQWSKKLNDIQADQGLKDAASTVAAQLGTVQGHFSNINQYLRNLDDAQRAYQALVAQGQRIQGERDSFRKHAAAVVQGYRTRDAAFRIFRNEKLERYKTLFDTAAKYAYLAAKAYDYETGLLNTDQGRSFLNRIVSARALGVIAHGAPQYAGSSTGDPGLSSALAEMKADWDVLKGRLGFNNPDGYGTTVSLRTENYRKLAGPDGDLGWKAVLEQGRTANLLADSDVKRHCLQIDDGSGLPVPGIVLTFETVIADGQNLFGEELCPGDHNFSPSSFATKIFSMGVAFEGYIGMDNPSANSGAGGTSPPDPTTDPDGLAATPYVYLIPVGTDSMRSPPLGDVSSIRTWNVQDLTIPLPFNVSAADFSDTPFYRSADSLSEPLFAVRKHQAFRPVSTTAAFNPVIYGAGGGLQPSQFTNKRLIGRSVWNSKWKLVIPGKTLLANPNQGLNRFVSSVKDIKLYFLTYSYSGN